MDKSDIPIFPDTRLAKTEHQLNKSMACNLRCSMYRTNQLSDTEPQHNRVDRFTTGTVVPWDPLLRIGHCAGLQKDYKKTTNLQERATHKQIRVELLYSNNYSNCCTFYHHIPKTKYCNNYYDIVVCKTSKYLHILQFVVQRFLEIFLSSPYFPLVTDLFVWKKIYRQE